MGARPNGTKGRRVAAGDLTKPVKINPVTIGERKPPRRSESRAAMLFHRCNQYSLGGPATGTVTANAFEFRGSIPPTAPEFLRGRKASRRRQCRYDELRRSDCPGIVAVRLTFLHPPPFPVSPATENAAGNLSRSDGRGCRPVAISVISGISARSAL